MKEPLRIDPYLFQQHLDAFVAFVERKSTVPFESFASHPYTEEQEGYKRTVYATGREALGFWGWSQASIGSGEIADAVIRAIEVKDNNLVQWQPRYGEAKRPHQPLYEAREDRDALQRLEGRLFDLYRNRQPERQFDDLVGIVGKRYPVLAYLYFLKDCSRFMPIAAVTFENAFSYLGVPFRASGQCSWSNYASYISILRDLRAMLSEELSSDVSLLEAHSFAYILARQMKDESALPDVLNSEDLKQTEREAVVKTRVGQEKFREALIRDWGSCAVTGLRDQRLLVASHIIPWKEADPADRLNVYNGLLLAPHLDAAFNAGLISFDDEGLIMLSQQLSCDDARALGIHQEMRLREVGADHGRTLRYHRQKIFKAGERA